MTAYARVPIKRSCLFRVSTLHSFPFPFPFYFLLSKDLGLNKVPHFSPSGKTASVEWVGVINVAWNAM